MAITPYLAMTAAEFAGCGTLPPKVAWMACHFSPYATGVSNLPASLPPGALLILNDTTPIHRHDPDIIVRQLLSLYEDAPFSGVLLDFQRPCSDLTLAIAERLCKALPCPTAVPASLKADDSVSVFLPPCPLQMPLAEYIAPWNGRKIWLELSGEEVVLQVTEQGTSIVSPCSSTPENGFQDSELLCHYKAEITDHDVSFHLWRTRTDLLDFLQHAEDLGVVNVVGLYQELGKLL